MKMNKQYNRRKRALTVVAIVIVVALVFAYVLQITALGATTPPPDQPEDPGYGTDLGFDDSTLPAPWEDDEDDTPLPELMIISGPVRLNVGERVMIQFVMENFPSGTLLEWRTSNPDVAVVSSDGVLMAVAPGNTEVIASAGDLRASVLVTVNDLVADSIIIGIDERDIELVAETAPRSYQITVGDVIRLSSKILPAGAKVEKINWTIGNDNVASISANGQNCVLTAVAIGSTTLSVSADGIKSSPITITIVESGVSITTLWDIIKYVVIIVIVGVGVAVFLTWLSQKRKKEKARAKAAAKRRREEAEKRARAEAERRTREEAERRPNVEANRMGMDRETRNTRPSEGRRETFKSSGAAVGAGVSAPPSRRESEPERPVTLDDLD